MPRMGGRELGRRLQEQSPHLPVLYMSGYVDPGILQGDFSGKEDRIIQKPFRATELCACVREALDRTADTSEV